MAEQPPVEQPRRNLTGAIVPALAAAGLAGLGAMLIVGMPQDGPSAAPTGCIVENADAVGGAISLVDANGNRVTQADFSGEPAVLFFGFTHCPDICPTAMYVLGEAMSLPGAHDAQSVLISVDPERDTPDAMGAYVQTGGFPAGLVGLTGTPEQVRAAADAFRVVYQKRPIEGAAEDVYNVDHTGFFYVMDGNWRTAAIMPSQTATPETLNACIAAGLDQR
ncbi:MAG: SCO family protein [Hyphomonadaceae bacterium]